MIKEGTRWTERRKGHASLAGVVQWVNCPPAEQRAACFPVSAGAWVVGQVPSWGRTRQQQIDVFLFLPAPQMSEFRVRKILIRRY